MAGVDSAIFDEGAQLSSFGRLRGRSVPMRRTFALLQAAARSDVTVLIEGETGTGKDEAAVAIHAAGRRATGPLVIIDCAAIPGNLLESELFGYERGAFTGATAPRLGAFAEANGGTVLLDEVGELPLELQPKLLRVLESKKLRRIGSNHFCPVDARIIAATNRDLRSQVAAQLFRADLYFRLSVLRVAMPTLRDRAEDIPLIARHLLLAAGASPVSHPALFDDDFFEALTRFAWPGNVRELRNYLDCCVVIGAPLPLPEMPPAAEDAGWGCSIDVDVDLPYVEARARCIAAFERAFATEALRKSGGNIARAAATARIDRAHLWRMVKRSGIATH